MIFIREGTGIRALSRRMEDLIYKREEEVIGKSFVNDFQLGAQFVKTNP